MGDHESDAMLLAGILQGDRSALETLYDRYERMVYSFAYRCVGDAAGAEEIVQDVFLKLWRTTARYDAAQGKVTTWLLTITRTAAIDYHRRHQRKQAMQTTDDTLVQFSDPGPGPDQMVELAQMRTLVREAMRELPTEQRETVEQMYYRGMTQQQIADQLGISVGTVKSRVRLALAKLKHRLEADGLGADGHV